MGYSFFDLPSMTSPILGAAAPAGPSGITGLLQDRNFLSLLAGIGQNLDPKGAGGAIGGPTRAMIASQAAQDRAAQQAAAQNAQTRMVIEALRQHGGMSDKDTPGVTSLKSTPTGLQMEITPKTAPNAYSAVEAPPAVNATVPTPSSTLPNPNIVAEPGTGQDVNIPSIDPSTGTLLPSKSTSRSNINQLLPFYSALLR